MNKYRDYIFVCLLLVGGVVFFAFGGMRGQYMHEMKTAQKEVLEQAGMSVSDNGLMPGTISENSVGNLTEAADQESAEPAEGTGSDNTVSRNDVVSDPGWTYVNVDESYFDDAVFIGDSRTVGLYDYAGLDNATFYASSGLTVYKLFEDPDGKFKDGNWKENIGTALERQQFGKVYLMIGINEMGTGDVDYFISHYTEAVERIRQLQPNAVIYLESIMRVTTERSNQGDYINNQGIDERNRRIAQLADDQTVFYLDVNSVVCDETGGLNPEYTFDGVHLYAQYIDIWKTYLMEHAVSVNP